MASSSLLPTPDLPMRLVLALLLAAPLLLTACAGQQHIITEQRRTIDSLYTLERTLRADLYALQDSIQFYDAVDSGHYFREQRLLEDRIDRLEFMLATRADTLCQVQAVTTLLVENLFEPASATLTDEGTEHLTTLAERLHADYPNRSFRIEGHSDNVPVGASLRETYPSNWELSAARATAVVRHLVEAHEMAPARLEAVALGDTRPVAPNTTVEGRRQNRRIEVLVLPE